MSVPVANIISIPEETNSALKSRIGLLTRMIDKSFILFRTCLLVRVSLNTRTSKGVR